MVAELAVRDTGALAEVSRPSSGLALSFGEMTMRVAQLDQFYREVMQDGTDYGKIPGTDKPTLYQPGAQMLDQIFGYVPTFEVTSSSVIDWQRPIPFFHYIIVCRLVSRRSGEVVAEGIGSCNSHEDKYRWRNAKRVCPDCKAEAIIKGKQEYGGGWLCFKRNGGCGAKFRDGEMIIEGQAVGRVENEDSASLENTISKMAQKRAHIAATLNATGASRIFTQDIEDLPQFQQATVVQAASSTAPARDDEPPIQPDDDIDARLDAAGRKGPQAKTRGPQSEQASQPADAETHAKFEANWTKGTARAVAAGVAPDDKPGADATKGQLNTAQRELLELIVTREKLNAHLLEQITAVRAIGGELADVDPATCTDTEIHEMLSTLGEMLALGPGDPDDAPF